MSMTIRSKHFVVMGLVALAVGSLGFTGCDAAEDAAGGNCAANLEAKMDAFSTSADALVDVAGKMKLAAYTACSGIATDLGGDVAAPAKADEPTDDEVKGACAAASGSLDAAISASGGISVSIEGGKCEVDASAQLDCEGKCNVDLECEANVDVAARCDPGELSVKCEGTCKAGATCQGTAEVAADCTGECGGSCQGTCEGTCAVKNADGSCNGSCEGTCTGKCTGECKITATGGVSCGAEASCKGGCEGTATAPKCEAALKADASCKGDADCSASCEGEASFKAECSPPSVKVVVAGSADAKLGTTLEANLPKLLAVVEQGEFAVKAAANLATTGTNVLKAMGDAGACAVSLVGKFTAKAEASVKASASVSVSVNASASASGSASGG